ncbi:hypothetical protein [Elizabethkingia anophelis]|uniref:hypothetical protein n=1 Tax=Elizabethkingia anophelis TaxID=1117645 RepID=UPI000442C3A2|nr:hypothetical protein [Elizabethkingia anophelis]CDN79550.1 conserved hypothetical protein [Elizabethkingia anophelis]
MNDYKEEMKELFSKYYSPTGDEYQKKYMSTYQVYAMFKGIVPSTPFSENDTYEILKELRYQQELYILKTEEILVEEDEEVDEEKDLKEVGRVFRWVVFERDLD